MFVSCWFFSWRDQTHLCPLLLWHTRTIPWLLQIHKWSWMNLIEPYTLEGFLTVDSSPFAHWNFPFPSTQKEPCLMVMINLQTQMVILLLLGPPFLLVHLFCIITSVSDVYGSPLENNLIDFLLKFPSTWSSKTIVKGVKRNMIYDVLPCFFLPTLFSMPLSSYFFLQPNQVWSPPCHIFALRQGYMIFWLLGTLAFNLGELLPGLNQHSIMLLAHPILIVLKSGNLPFSYEKRGTLWASFKKHSPNMQIAWIDISSMKCVGRWLSSTPSIPMWYRCCMVHFGSGQNE